MKSDANKIKLSSDYEKNIIKSSSSNNNSQKFALSDRNCSPPKENDFSDSTANISNSSSFNPSII